MNQASLMVKIARLYYEDGETQQNIADKLGLTRLRVIDLLKKARVEGIVQIKVIDPSVDFNTLENAIAAKYGLKRAIVIPLSMDKVKLQKRNLGKAASSYLDEILKDEDVLGIGWGLSVAETVNSMENFEKRSVTVVPLIGGGSETLPQYDVNELARKAAEVIGGNFHSLYAPALVDSKEIRDIIKPAANIPYYSVSFEIK